MKKKNPYMSFFFPYPRGGIRAYMGPNIRLILSYRSGDHISTYNVDNKTSNNCIRVTSSVGSINEDEATVELVSE